MANSLFQYWVESALGLLLFWGLYRALRKRMPLIVGKTFLATTPVLAMCIPLLDLKLAVASTQIANSSLAGRWIAQIETLMGGYLKVSGLSLLSLVYFLVAAVLLFRLVDRLADLIANQKRFLEIWEFLLLEGSFALFWFQPLLLLFRAEMRKLQYEKSASLPSRQLVLKLVLPVLILTCLLSWLFAANQATNAPVWNQLESRANTWQAKLETPIFQLGTPREVQTLMGWGGYWMAFTPLAVDAQTHYSVSMLSPFEFFSIAQQTRTWQRGGWDLKPVSVEALVAFPLKADPLHLANRREIQHFLDDHRYSTEFTLFLKMTDQDGSRWLGIVGVSEKDRVYGYEDVLQTWDATMPELLWRKGQDGEVWVELLPHSPYTLVWGDFKLPLNLRANPDVYSGYAAFELEEFTDLVDHPIRFFYRDSLLIPETIRIRETEDNVWPYNFNNSFRSIRQEGADTHLEIDVQSLRQATNWIITATLPGGIEVNAINLHIRDDDTSYDPVLWAPRLATMDSLYSFQLITRDEPPSILKLDTTLVQNQKLIDMYRAYDAYRIIHVPGFRTHDRLVQVPEDQMWLIRDEDLPRDSIFLGDRLPDLPYEVLDTMHLEWGDLFAATNSEVYSLEAFTGQIGNAPWLHTPGSKYELYSFVLYFFSEDKPLHAEWYSYDRIKNWSTQDLVALIQPKTSLFFDQIVVRNEAGDLWAAPISYAFHIGKSERDIRWKVVLEEVPEHEAGEKERIEAEQSLKFHNYRLRELIALLSKRELNRMEFRGLAEDPLVNVELLADGPIPGRAREFMLDELQRQYRFDISHGRLPRPNWRLHLKDPDLLTLALFEGGDLPGEKIRVFQWDGTHVLTGVTLRELTMHLEERFDEIIEWFPNPYLRDHFSFSLNCASMTAVQQQLENEYGIVFQRMETLWQGTVVQFY